MSSLKKWVSITFLSRVATFVFALATSIILARVLGPNDRGRFSLIILITSILVLIGSLGMEFANVYFSANRRYRIGDIISNSLISSLGLGLIIILLFWLASTLNVFQEFFSKNSIPFAYLWLAIITVPITFLLSFFRGVLLGREEILKFNSLNIFQSILQLGLLAFFLIFLAQGLFGALLSYIIVAICGVFIATLFVSKLANISFSFNFKLLKEFVRYGGKGYIGNIAQFLNYRMDMFFVAYFLDPASVGYYAIAVGIAEKLWLIPGSVSTVLFPRISAIEDTQANKLTPIASRHTLFIVFVTSLVLIVFAKPLILLLFGIDFLPSVKPLVILQPGIVVLSFCKILTSDLAGRGRPEIGTLAAFVSLAVNIPLNIFLLERWGISGAAFASSVAYCLATMIVLIAFSRISKTSWSDILLIKRRDFLIYSEMCLRGIRRIRLRGINKG